MASTSGVSDFAACPLLLMTLGSAISHLLSLLRSVTLLACSLSASPCMPAVVLCVCVCVCVLVPQSCPTLCDPWTHQAPLFMELSRQEYWSGLPFPSPGDLPIPGIESRSPALQADFLPSELPGKLCCTVLLCFSRYCNVGLKMFSLFFVSVFNVLFV